IKSQILADFILELSSPPDETSLQPWTLSIDGSSNLRGSGAGVVSGERNGLTASDKSGVEGVSGQRPPTHQVSGIDNNRTVIQETITKPTCDPGIWMIMENKDWRTLIIQYLQSEKLPDEKEEAVRVRKWRHIIQ
ncbi:hypothetical protein A2U01_0036817, partial [Trifolium medium]|nr:hypothetical protein [Trifolium medium]